MLYDIVALYYCYYFCCRQSRSFFQSLCFRVVGVGWGSLEGTYQECIIIESSSSGAFVISEVLAAESKENR